MKKTIYSDKQKAQVALEAIKGQKPINQISSQYQIHPTQIQNWKAIAMEGLPGLFSSSRDKDKTLTEKDKLIDDLYRIIGQRDTELEWIKKNCKYLTHNQKKALIEKHNPSISIKRQAELLGLSRSSQDRPN